MITLGTCLLGALGNNTQAQITDFADLNATINLVDVIDITANPGVGGTSATFDDISEYTNGIENITAANLTVKSTKQYSVSYKALGPDFVGPTSTIPIAKLLISAGGANAYVPLVEVDAPLFVNQGFTASTVHPVDYKFDVGFNNYVAENGYVATIRYTATQD